MINIVIVRMIYLMLEKKATDFLEILSSKEPVPGGGGASSFVGALAASLGLMVTNLTVGKKKYFDVEEEIKEIQSKLIKFRDQLVQLVDEDAEAFKPLSKAYSLPKETEEQRVLKEQVMEGALYDASIVPLKIMETTLGVMKLLKELEKKGSKLAVSDIGVGILFASAALEGASLNVFINTKLMKKRAVAEKLNQQAECYIGEEKSLKEEVYQNVLLKIK